MRHSGELSCAVVDTGESTWMGVGPWERADPTSDSRICQLTCRGVVLCHAGQGFCWGLALPEKSGSLGTGGSSPGCHLQQPEVEG